MFLSIRIGPSLPPGSYTIHERAPAVPTAHRKYFGLLWDRQGLRQALSARARAVVRHRRGWARPPAYLSAQSWSKTFDRISARPLPGAAHRRRH